ncbi:TatD DNase family protein [Sediminihabitans luteus]|uniref:TatD DNase family protein n=1 Tax=Sediminihabitans luteus TaxID=1138585 RepID=A0A2M9CD88_9CELL|nr:TatD family hydrolase [Sediminihabitans luteus]PJJ69847.1 TatD DNase family protein [Sediminihabitans luteus]GIJ00631.1 hydrolase TatD [Sediminihabitans luteus]
MARRRERGWPPAPEPLPVPVVDDHTHLDAIAGYAAGVTDRVPDAAGELVERPIRVPGVAELVAEAAAVGVTRMVTVGCDLDAVRWTDALLAGRPLPGVPAEVSDAAAALAPVRAALLGAVAIHPNEATLHAGVTEVGPDGLTPTPEARHATSLDDAIAEVAAVARANERVRAIGETGMDLFRTGPQGEQVQRESFRAHVALAKELGLALQIHDRDAHAEVIDVLLRDGAPERTVFHCFSGDAEMARTCAEQGWFLSFAGPVTFGANDGLRAALHEVPLSQVLVETDAPYLTPHPFRGRPNAPYLLPHTVRGIAAELDRDLAEVCTALSSTAERVYGSW